ncbi:MAG: hypothetical protein P9M15_03950 [Candidatus Electryoneaceae bacterium]|nr:hypothetical protein [Candidatus Electryoneaceae bacterium]
MADTISDQELADAIVKMVTDAAGVKKYKAMDIIKLMVQTFGDRGADKKRVKTIIKNVVNEGHLVYTYFGGSFVEVPHREGAAND